MAGISVSGGNLVLTCESGYAVADFDEIYDLTGSSLTAQIAALPAAGTGTTEASFLAWHDSDNYLLILKSSTTLLFRVRDSGVNTDNFATYSAVNHVYWRFEVVGANVLFRTSPDNSTWTTHYTVAHTMATQLAAVSPRFTCGYYGTETTPGDFLIAAVNPAPLVVGPNKIRDIAQVAANPQVVSLAGKTTGRDLWFFFALEATPSSVPSGWVEHGSELMAGGGYFVKLWRLPAASNTGGVTDISIAMNGAAPILGCLWEDSEVFDSGAALYFDAYDQSPTGATPALWGTNLHTFTARDHAFAFYVLSPLSTRPSWDLVSYDQGYAEFSDSGWAGGAGLASCRAWLAKESPSSMAADGVTATSNGLAPVIGGAVGMFAFSTVPATGGTAFPRTASDSWSVSGTAVAGIQNFLRPAADSVTLSDAAARAPVTRTRPLADTVTLSDAAVRAPAARPRAVPDSVVLSDSAVRAPAARVRPASDSVALSDAAVRAPATRTRAVPDSIVLSDAAVRAPATPVRPVADTVALSDAVSRVSVFTRPAADAVAMSDAAAGVFGQGTQAFVRTASDTVAVSDSVARVSARARGVADSVVLVDVAARAPAARVRPVADGIVLSDVATRAVVARVRTATDSWTASDVAVRALGARVRSAADSWVVSDGAQRVAATRVRTASDIWAISDSTTGLDTAPPLVTVSSAAEQKLSDESGKDSYFYGFQATEACQAYEIMVVPAPDSTRAAGTLVESGGAISANTTINGSVTFAELQAAGQASADGAKILKFFARDVAGNWST